MKQPLIELRFNETGRSASIALNRKIIEGGTVLLVRDCQTFGQLEQYINRMIGELRKARQEASVKYDEWIAS